MGRPWIEHWTPDDEEFWEQTGKRIARRNLAFSIFAEFLGFVVWALWGATTASMNKAGYGFTTAQLFGLVSIAGLVGALVRIPYIFAVARFGGRNWTIVSAALLIIPVTMMTMAFTLEAPYWFFYLAAGTAGLGGGNFASSMANISYFYPDRKKGFALGLNAAGGNLGVAVAQLLVPVVVTLAPLAAVGAVQGGTCHSSACAAGRGTFALQNAALILVPFIVATAVCAWLFMDNLRVARTRPRQQLQVLKRKHTWVMAWIYVGTFGSFIGFSGAFPLLIKTQFPHVTMAVAFLGPMLGSLSRPLGGWLADRVGGARITSFVLSGLIAATGGLLWVLDHAGEPWAFPAFFWLFVTLFVLCGLGNGSTYRSIPAIFRASALAAPSGGTLDQRLLTAKWETAAVVGFIGSIGALGGFLVPQAFAVVGGPRGAFPWFLAFYVSCFALNWWYYLRRSFAAALPSTLAAANV